MDQIGVRVSRKSASVGPVGLSHCLLALAGKSGLAVKAAIVIELRRIMANLTAMGEEAAPDHCTFADCPASGGSPPWVIT